MTSAHASVIQRSSAKGTRTATQIVDEVVGVGLRVQQLIANFEVLVDANTAVEKLRGLVLHLAIQGRLLQETPCTQQETDTSPGLSVPFGLPGGWAWRRVTELGELKLGRQRSPKNHSGPNMRPYLRVANVFEGRIDTSDVLTMNFDPGEAERFALRPNDLLLNEGQSYDLVGRPAIYRGEVPGACFQNTLIRFRPTQLVHPEFALVVFRAYMRTGRFRREAQQTTNIAHLSLGRLAEIEFPLPPIAEQKRIVAKVDQLMSLCDELEARQTRKRALGARFTKSALDALTSAETSEEFDVAWQRVLSNFDVLFGRAEDVDRARMAIVGLACRGALTGRGVGTSIDFLTAIRERRQAARAQFVEKSREQERHISKLAQQVSVAPNTVLPQGWAWATLLAACAQLVDCHNKTAPYVESGVMLVRTSNIRNGRIQLDGVRHVSEATYAHWSRRCPPQPGDVLFTREAPMGEVGLVESGMRLCMGQRMMLLRVWPDLVAPEYLALALRDPAFQQRMVGVAVGSTVKHLRVGDVESLFVPIPPREEQDRIVSTVGQLLRVCDDLEAKLRRTEDRATRLIEAVVQDLVS